MFEELKRKLESIDAVLNEEDMDSLNALDISRGFRPDKEYTPKQVEEFKFKGIEALSKSGKESSYVVLEVVIEKDGNKYARLFLRGFDVPTNSQPILAETFLRRELRTALSPPFELPIEWPHETSPMGDFYEKAVISEAGGLRLTISAIGSGQFDLKYRTINLKGPNLYFGSVPEAYKDRFRELLEQLVKKSTYRSFTI